MPTFEYENIYYEKGYNLVAGTDEAGRGPLAGPVCAAAVILPRGYMPEGLNDSKKLSEKKRLLLFDEIKRNAVSYAVAYASVDEIDTLNILNASQLAMRRAVDALSPSADFVLIDGNVSKYEMNSVNAPIVKFESVSEYIIYPPIAYKITNTLPIKKPNSNLSSNICVFT